MITISEDEYILVMKGIITQQLIQERKIQDLEETLNTVRELRNIDYKSRIEAIESKQTLEEEITRQSYLLSNLIKEKTNLQKRITDLEEKLSSYKDENKGNT